MKNTFKKLYFDPSLPSSFGGINKLKKKTDKTKQSVKHWLRHQDAYTLHKPIRLRFPRRRTIVSGIREQFQCDLIDTQKLKRENDGYSYILTCIDVFSKKAFVRAIKNKTSTQVIPALESIFAISKPRRLQTDKGGEFLSRAVQRYLQDEGIKHFTSQNETIKASIVERFQRTFQEKLWRFFTKTNSFRYLEVLEKLEKAYNESYHRSIKRRPIDVNIKNQEEVWQDLYGKTIIQKKKPSLKPGYRVRISKLRGRFQKSFTESWSHELFTVSRVLNTNPITYVIKADDGEEIKGSFYAEELQQVGEKNTYTIENIVREKKGKGGKRLCLVKWFGYPSSYNSWVEKSSIKQL